MTLTKPSVSRLVLARLSQDWQARYGHPVLVVETFVDPDQFCGTVYTANGWEELGQTDGWGRQRRDYYVKPDILAVIWGRFLRLTPSFSAGFVAFRALGTVLSQARCLPGDIEYLLGPRVS